MGDDSHGWRTGEPDEEPSDDFVDADEEVRDSLPADLDPSRLVGPVRFPNNSRRRVPGVLYIVIGIVAVVVWAVVGEGAVLVNGGVAIAGAALVVIGLYHLQAGWDLAVDESEALVEATREVGFPVGHASAQLGWRGLRSRPTWRILLYSNEDVPEQRGLVLVDGIDGEIIDQFVERNPEDWTGYT
ncbi:MAG: hypothetical protein ACE5GB_10065 [Acidimicrobiales bacterium]